MLFLLQNSCIAWAKPSARYWLNGTSEIITKIFFLLYTLIGARISPFSTNKVDGKSGTSISPICLIFREWIRYEIANVVPGAGSVASPGSFVSSGVIDWNAGFHGSFSVESYATGCDGIENPNPGVHTARIYETLAAPSDISYDPLTLPNCPAVSGDTTQFTSSTQVTWSWNNELAGNIDSVSGLVTWADGWSGTVVITATSFGCGGQSLSRTVVIPDSPGLTRTSALFTTNQNVCVGSDISSIRYEINGSATGADVTGINDLNLFEQLTSKIKCYKDYFFSF